MAMCFKEMQMLGRRVTHKRSRAAASLRLDIIHLLQGVLSWPVHLYVGRNHSEIEYPVLLQYL